MYFSFSFAIWQITYFTTMLWILFNTFCKFVNLLCFSQGFVVLGCDLVKCKAKAKVADDDFKAEAKYNRPW